MSPDLAQWDHHCPRCLTPNPVLPTPDDLITWAEQHETECAEAQKARAA